MKKRAINVMSLVAVGVLFLAVGASAQQTPASGAAQSSAPAASTSTPKIHKAPAAKTAPSAAARTPSPLILKTQKEKVSYAIGMNIGKGMHRDGVDVDSAILARAIRDELAGRKPALTDQEAQAALSNLQAELQAKKQELEKKLGDANMTEGQAFLDANKSKEGVVTLPSGLQYKILTAGTGPKPAAADSVICNYRGTLINGTEFDSSYKRGQPATFPVGGVIRGWTEALQLMPVGSKWQLFVPPDLAYGARGNGPSIGPNSTLIFEVELLSIKGK
jgi:FKBP-type peptidyl-prolyl cis-trans isomerase